VSFLDEGILFDETASMRFIGTRVQGVTRVRGKCMGSRNREKPLTPRQRAMRPAMLWMLPTFVCFAAARPLPRMHWLGFVFVGIGLILCAVGS
jgi:hypothetical protein